MEPWSIALLGTIAGLCTTASFVPQVVKAWRKGDTGAISKRMYVTTLAAFVVWLAYGFVIGSWPIVVFNLVSIVLSGTVLVLKLRQEREASQHGVREAS